MLSMRSPLLPPRGRDFHVGFYFYMLLERLVTIFIVQLSPPGVGRINYTHLIPRSLVTALFKQVLNNNNNNNVSQSWKKVQFKSFKTEHRS